MSALKVNDLLLVLAHIYKENELSENYEAPKNGITYFDPKNGVLYYLGTAPIRTKFCKMVHGSNACMLHSRYWAKPQKIA